MNRDEKLMLVMLCLAIVATSLATIVVSIVIHVRMSDHVKRFHSVTASETFGTDRQSDLPQTQPESGQQE